MFVPKYILDVPRCVWGFEVFRDIKHFGCNILTTHSRIYTNGFFSFSSQHTVRGDKDVESVTADNNSKMFNKSEVYFDTKFSKVALQKELARRTAVQFPG
jgi:hypothetical protein